MFAGGTIWILTHGHFARGAGGWPGGATNHCLIEKMFGWLKSRSSISCPVSNNLLNGQVACVQGKILQHLARHKSVRRARVLFFLFPSSLQGQQLLLHDLHGATQPPEDMGGPAACDQHGAHHHRDPRREGRVAQRGDGDGDKDPGHDPEAHEPRSDPSWLRRELPSPFSMEPD